MTLTVLVQHADKSLLDSVSDALTLAGITMLRAVDGADGLALLQGHRVDAIITGLNMPNLDGFSFIEAVRQQEHLGLVPILMLSRADMPELRARARNAGASGWLPQPFDGEKLVAMIRAVCP